MRAQAHTDTCAGMQRTHMLARMLAAETQDLLGR